MKSFKFAERTILCGQASQWEELIGASDRDTPGTVVDLRTFLEIGEQQVPKPPEGWGYRRLPLTGVTVSEQDLDVFRREFYRKPQTVVVGPNAVRVDLVVAASIARLEKGGFNGGKRAQDDHQGEEALLEWLTSYLVRHGFEEEGALEAVQSRRPATSKPAAAKPKPKAPEARLAPVAEAPEDARADCPFEPVEATVELPAVGSLLTDEVLETPVEPSVELNPPAEPSVEVEPSVEMAAIETEPPADGSAAEPKTKKTKSASKGKAKSNKSKGSPKRKK